MARRTPPPLPGTSGNRDGAEGPTGTVVDIDVAEEMQGSFLEYAYSVIYSRALPDARDGLKPVHRRILFQMAGMGLRPDRPHVKCARVVGDVMGRLHPHGDTAIYDTLVRLAQPFSMRLPLVDGQGNFGSLDDGPAAYRYTECRMARPALLMTDGLDEDVVDLRPNYDGQQQEPEVLPSAFPNLLVNGASGIAVGMATNMPPHNLVEVVGAARHLVAHPDATLDDLMRFVPGPDLPTGGRIVGLEGVREAYETGRGTFRTRATTSVENVTARRKAIVVSELPLGVGPERIKKQVVELVQGKRLQGIADIADYTDSDSGLRLVIELKAGFVPEAVLEQLYRLTSLEESFGVNNVTLVEGRPRTLGLRELLRVYVGHRLDVVRRRTRFRLGRAQERLHLVRGRLVAVLDIDEVIAVIRSSEDAVAARERLMSVFDLDRVQADDILELPLRRLTRFSVLELERERDELEATIASLTELLGSDPLLRRTVSDELAEVAREFGTPRRTVLLEGGVTPVRGAGPVLEVGDDPCRVLLSSTGLLARLADGSPADGPPGDGRAAHDVVVSSVATTVRGEVGVATSRGRLLRLGVLELPALPPTASAPALAGGAPVAEFVPLEKGERVVGLLPVSGPAGEPDAPGAALATAQGVVKRVAPEHPAREAYELITLRPRDEVVGVAQLATGDEDLVLVTSDAQLLRFGGDAVRPQGRAAGGVAGVRLAPGQSVVFFGAVDPGADPVVVTVAGSSAALAGTEPGTVKVAPYAEFPAKGRGTGGVRCHRFLRGEDRLLLAWAGPGPARAAGPAGVPVPLPPPTGRRDGSGTPLPTPVAAVSGPVG